MDELRSKALNALLMCCQVGCGSKQPIYDYITKLEKIRELVEAGKYDEAEKFARSGQ